MMGQTTTDGGTNPNDVDDRLAKIKTITISFETFKNTLQRNFLDDRDQRGRNFVLRLCPPFQAEMDTESYVSEQGVHYDNNWTEKPAHIPPEYLIREGTDRGFRGLVGWPTETTTRNALTDEEIDERGGIDAAIEDGRELFWNELQHSLPDEIDLGRLSHPCSHVVEIEWED